MRVILCGGGTAGHVTPAIAIAESILKKFPEAQILFIGRENGEENRAITNRGFPLQTVKICGFERKLSIKNLKNVRIALTALKKAKKIIKSFSPDAVVGTGGYVCWPVLKSAQNMKIPTVIHESNAAPGLATRVLSKKCDRVLLNLQGSERAFKRQDNIRIVGNPVRDEFINQSRHVARKKLGLSDKEFFIFSFGGSGGSKSINDTVSAVMASHSMKNTHIRHLHLCGTKYYDELKRQMPNLIHGKCGCIIKPYCDDMATMMLASDIIISRSGAMTLAEMSATGACGILIPSPNVTNNHQYENAKLICDAKGGLMIQESELNERTLCDTIKALENDAMLRKTIRSKIKEFHVHNAGEKIADEIKSLI